MPIPALYESMAGDVDATTGVPKDYETFAVMYRSMIASIAEKMKIPRPDIEDAVQEIQLKFWAKGGLDLFDESRGKFPTFFRNWAGKFLLQERDKTLRFNNKNELNDALKFFEENNTAAPNDFIAGVVSDEFAIEWTHAARQELDTKGKQHLLPLFDVYVDAAAQGEYLTQSQIGKLLKCAPHRVSKLKQELRAALAAVNFGKESLHV